MWYFSTLVDVLFLKTYYNILIRFVKVAFWFIHKGNSQNTSRVKFKQVHLEEISWSTNQEKKNKMRRSSHFPLFCFTSWLNNFTDNTSQHILIICFRVLQAHFLPLFYSTPPIFYSSDRELNTSLMCLHGVRTILIHMWRWLLLSLKQYLIFSISITEKTVSLLRVEVRPGKPCRVLKLLWNSCICLDTSQLHLRCHHLPMKSSIFAFHFPFCRIPFLHYFSVFSQLSLMQLFVSLHVYCNLPPTLICLHSGVAVFTRDPLANPNIDIMLVWMLPL